MKLRSTGLQGKFVVALLVAAALPFLLGLLFFETTGYRHLLRERGQFHRIEAHAVVRNLDLAAAEQAAGLRAWLAADASLTELAAAANESLAARGPDDIARETRELDRLWPSLLASDPRLTAVLDNPASASLRQYQRISPQAAEILATDNRGRLIAATGKSSDYQQSDEPWWISGAALKPGERRIDALRFDDSSRVFSLDAILPLYAKQQFAGVVKMSVDVTALFAGLTAIGSADERWDIVLPDGSVLASSRDGVANNPRLAGDALHKIRTEPRGWALVDDGVETRLIGFVGLGAPGTAATAHVVFSTPSDAVVGPLRRGFLRIALAALALLGLCAWAGYFLIRRNVLRPLSTLGRAARSIAATARLHPAAADERELQRQREQVAADQKAIKAIATGDEIQTLAEDLAVMTSRVLRYQRELESEVAAKTSVIRQDLEMAREFQFALMPAHYPEVPPAASDNPLRLQFAHFYQPASTVGGDFFDLLELDRNRAGILIADVMGHGARSALVTAILRALVRHHSAAATEPGAFLSELNQHLREVVERSGQTLFVTAFFLVLDTRLGVASWAVAGHPAPLRVHRGSGLPPQPLWAQAPHQPALGLMAQVTFETTTTPLRAGDVFFLFTDGLIEAENPAGERFGWQRLIQSCDDTLDGPMAAVPAKIVCDVTAFQKRRHYDDDVCLVCVEAIKVAPEERRNAERATPNP